MANPLDEIIEVLESQKALVDEAVHAIESVGLDLSPELKSKVLESLRERVLEALTAKVGELKLREPRNNREKVIRFLMLKGNQPRTVDAIANGAGISKASLRQILHQHKAEFESEKSGEGKKLAWKLKNGAS